MSSISTSESDEDKKKEIDIDEGKFMQKAKKFLKPDFLPARPK